MAGRGHGDLIADLALPLPVTLICRILGVPDGDHDRVVRWSNQMVLQASPASVTEAGEALAGYLGELIDSGAAAGLSMLAGPGHGGDRLTRTELISTAFLLLFAGHETTVNLIGNGAHALLRHPGQLDRLRRDPSGWPAAVEELLRYDSPVAHATIRYTTAPVEIAGRTVPRGRFLLVSLAAANRDPRVFADPDRLDIGRDAAGHVAFGVGVHRCLGARLGRLQGRIALRELFERFPRIRPAVAPGRLRHRPSTLMRGLESLPVRWD
jgi:cytochrome P450